MKKKYLILICFFVMSAVVGVSSFPGMAFAKSSKQELKKENEQLENQNQKVQEEVKELDQKMEKINKEYERYSDRLATVKTKISKTQEDLKEAQESKKKQSEIMSKRIKFLYENGNTAYMEIIFEAKSFQEFLTKAEYVSKISKYDSTMFQKLQKTQHKIELASQSLKKEYDNISVITAKAKKEKDELEQTAASKKAKIEAYQQKLASNKDLLAQYEAEEKKQEEQQSQTPSYSGETVSGSGSLTWPVPSCHSISSGYGYRIHPVTGEKKFHAGIDIPCSTGSTIVSADGGTVVDAGYTAYNGNYLKISHGNGIETMYLHCSSLLVSSGSHVKKGQTIAKSGATGMVSGAHLHFVVKKNGSYVNPSNYL